MGVVRVTSCEARIDLGEQFFDGHVEVDIIRQDFVSPAQFAQSQQRIESSADDIEPESQQVARQSVRSEPSWGTKTRTGDVSDTSEV